MGLTQFTLCPSRKRVESELCLLKTLQQVVNLWKSLFGKIFEFSEPIYNAYIMQYARAHTRYTTTITKVFKLYCHVLQPCLNIKLKCIDVEIWNNNNKKYIGIFSLPYVPLWIKASPCCIVRLQSFTHSTSFHFISPQCLICYASSEIEVGFQAISSDGWWKHMGSTWKARSNASSSNNGFGQVDVTSGKSWQSWRTDMPCKLSGCGLSGCNSHYQCDATYGSSCVNTSEFMWQVVRLMFTIMSTCCSLWLLPAWTFLHP